MLLHALCAAYLLGVFVMAALGGYATARDPAADALRTWATAIFWPLIIPGAIGYEIGGRSH